MCAERYSLEHVLRGLRQLWEDCLQARTPFEPDARFEAAFIAEGFWEDLVLPEVIQDYFGFSFSSESWEVFIAGGVTDPAEWESTVAPRLTFRALAGFIREHLEPIRLEPVEILGRRCASAGVFRGLERMVQQHHPRARRFGPSTPIRRRLRGPELHRFWQRLRWIVPAELPLAPEVKLDDRAMGHGCLLKIVLSALVAFAVGDWSPLLTGFLTAVCLTVGLYWTVQTFNAWWISPLPPGVETFGDLAKFLAAEMGAGPSGSVPCSSA